MELKWMAGREGRLSSFLRGELELSAGLMNRLKYDRRFLVNGVPVFTNYPVKPGDRITVLLDERSPEYPAEDMDLTIVYEDDFLLALDKPAGMLIHPSRSRDTGTLANGVVGYYKRTGQQGAFHPCSRLDRDTFGIVLLGKNSHVHGLLGNLHTQGAIHKTYEALVWGRVEEDRGTIDAPIARRPLPILLRYVGPEGAPARTEFEVAERFEAFTHLRLHPITGKTHQLRVHCAYIGHPILGDPQYGTVESQALSGMMGYQGQRLCAVSLELPHPITKEPLVLKSTMGVKP